MLCKHRRPPGLILTSVLVAIVVLILARSRADIPGQIADRGGILYWVDSDANVPGFIAASESMACAQPNLVVVTHGWYERQAWSGWMAEAITRRVDGGLWQCGWYDWRTQARSLRLSGARDLEVKCATSAGGRRVGGPLGPAVSEQG
jgi:hypothetical protein